MSPENHTRCLFMYVVAIGWMYVVVMMTVAEAISPQGTILGAIITFVFYGLLPVSILVYIMGTGARKRKRLAAEQTNEQAAEESSAQPDGSGQPSGDAVTPERKEV